MADTTCKPVITWRCADVTVSAGVSWLTLLAKSTLRLRGDALCLLADSLAEAAKRTSSAERGADRMGWLRLPGPSVHFSQARREITLIPKVGSSEHFTLDLATAVDLQRWLALATGREPVGDITCRDFFHAPVLDGGDVIISGYTLTPLALRRREAAGLRDALLRAAQETNCCAKCEPGIAIDSKPGKESRVRIAHADGRRFSHFIDKHALAKMALAIDRCLKGVA